MHAEHKLEEDAVAGTKTSQGASNAIRFVQQKCNIKCDIVSPEVKFTLWPLSEIRYVHHVPYCAVTIRHSFGNRSRLQRLGAPVAYLSLTAKFRFEELFAV